MEKHLDNAAQSAAASEWRSVGTHSLRFHQSIVQMLGCERFNDFQCVTRAVASVVLQRRRGEISSCHGSHAIAKSPALLNQQQKRGSLPCANRLSRLLRTTVNDNFSHPITYGESY